MIRPLRQRHRAVICTLGVVLPIAFVAGIAARRPVPIARSVPAELERRASGFDTAIWTKAGLWPEQRIVTTLRRNAAGAVAVELMFRDIVKPDVLVYWVEGNRTAGGALPDHVRLLGALSNRSALAVPAEGRGETGRFVLYSLADHEIVSTSSAVTL